MTKSAPRGADARRSLDHAVVDGNGHRVESTPPLFRCAEKADGRSPHRPFDGRGTPGGSHHRVDWQRGPVEVTEVRDASDTDAFLRLPWRIHERDPAWVPPLIAERKEFIDPRKHPFYRHGAAERFLARRGGEVVGRILASDDPYFNAAHGTNLGCFGMFESVRDPAVAHALLDRAADWLAKRGRTRILGPVDYSTNYPLGLLVEGFDTPPAILMNHNPPWYADLLEAWGLRKAKDLYTYRIRRGSGPPAWLRRVAERAARRGVRARPVDLSDFDAEIDRLRDLYNRAWTGNWGFVQMTEAEFRHLAADLRRLLIPDLLMIAEVDGDPAGFCMSLPDINEVLPELNGRLLPLGWLRLWRALRTPGRIRAIRMLTLGVVEPYRRRGVAELLIARTFDACREHELSECEMGWNLEDNAPINRPIERLGSRLHKRYRLYERRIG